MKPDVVFALNEHQAEIVKPLFDKVKRAAEAHRPGMILCQLWGPLSNIQASARFIDEDIAIAVIAAVSAATKEEAT